MALKLDKILGKIREKDLSGAIKSSANLPFIYLTDANQDITRPGTIRIGYDTTNNYFVVQELTNTDNVWEELIGIQKNYP